MTESATVVWPLHPRRGPHNPTAGSPPRRPGSVRRTVTIDSSRPGGFGGPTTLLEAAGRDLLTRADGTAVVLAEASLRLEFGALAGNRNVARLTTTPDVPELARVIGVPAGGGFRAAVAAAAPDLAERNSLLAALLDDVPVAALVFGYAAQRHALETQGGADLPPAGALRRGVDQCAGWADGGTIILEVDALGQVPLVTGPVVYPVTREDDPLAWHPFGPLPAHAMRRHRRIDVTVPAGDAPGEAEVDAFFRDSHQADGGDETVIHEYTVTAAVAEQTGLFTAVEAAPRVLPWVECPRSVASAARLVGTPASEVRRRVSTEFVGTSTCTHLNDTLRALVDVPELAAAARRGR